MSSGFITEAEAADIRKRRQAEWENVRKPSDPIERPEQPYDNRSLFERLQEQKQKKELEYEEAHKLKNMIKGLDDDEVEFLDLVDRTKLAADRKKELEEERELNDYRNRVAILQEKSIEERLQTEIVVNKPKGASNNKLSQQRLLKGIVVKKTYPTKRKMSTEKEHSNDKSNDNERPPKQQMALSDSNGQGDTTAENSQNNPQSSSEDNTQTIPGSALKCVAILPGLGCYNDSSSDENSSDSDNSEIESKSGTDLLGRKLVTHKIVLASGPKK